MTRQIVVLIALMFFAATINNVLATDRVRNIRPGKAGCGARPPVQVLPYTPAPPRVRDCRPLTPPVIRPTVVPSRDCRPQRPPIAYPPIPPVTPVQPGCRPPRVHPYRPQRYPVYYYQPPVIYAPPVMPPVGPGEDVNQRTDYVWNEYTKQWEVSGEEFRVTGQIFRDPESNCLVFRDSQGRKHLYGY